jgi:trigger factor
MQVTEVANEGLKRGYSITVPAGDIAAERARRLAELGKELRIPGFRPGKVPAKVIQQRYGQAVMSEVLEKSVQTAADQVVTDRGLRPAQQPKIELVNFADGADLEFRIDMEVLPEIPMPEFAGIALERLKAVPPEATLDKSLAQIAERNRTLEDIEEVRGAAKGEIAVCDFTGKIDGVPFPGGEASEMPIEVAGEGFIPGFTEQLEGIAAGEHRTLEVSFPAEYGNAELAGKAATFDVTCKALKRAIIPPVDDELGKAIGYDSLEELRQALRDRLQREYDGLSRLKVKRALLDALAERASFPVPEGMIESEFAQIWERLEADKKAGRADAADAEKDEATLKAEYRAIAERRIRLGLLLSEIGRTNNISVTQEELARAMRAEAGRFPGQEREVMEFFRNNPQASDNLRSPIFEEKVVDFMLELAQVTDREVTPEELSAAAQA